MSGERGMVISMVMVAFTLGLLSAMLLPHLSTNPKIGAR